MKLSDEDNKYPLEDGKYPTYSMENGELEKVFQVRSDIGFVLDTLPLPDLEYILQLLKAWKSMR